MAAYNQVFGQAQGAANAPLNLYNIGPNASNLVAPISPLQREANTQIANIAYGAQNNPYVAQAGSEINNILANPIGTGIPTFNTSGLPSSGLSAYGTAQQLGSSAASLAGGMTGLGSVPGYNTLGTYESPYTQEVTQALQSQFNQQNAQQQSQVAGNAAAQGAWGGDRSAVAAALTAGQQQLTEAPELAQVEQQGFQQAQGELNTQQQLALSGLSSAAQTELAATQPQLAAAQGELGEYNAEQQLQLGEQQAQGWLGEGAAYALGNLGQEQQGLALQGSQALEGVGAQTQAEHQAQLNVPYEQFEQQQAYPFQTTGWLANIAEGIGSQEGGTATTQYPPPSALSQVAGAGLTGLGIYGLGSQTGLWSGLGGFLGGAGGIGGSAALGSLGAAGAFGSMADFSAAVPAAAAVAGARRGGRIAHRASGGTLDYPGYQSAPQPQQPAVGPQVPNPAEPFIGSAPLSVHPGMGPPRPPSGGIVPPGQQNPATQGMQTALQAAQIRRLLGGAPSASGGSFAFGGAVPAGLSEPLHLDLGGSALMQSGEAMEGGQGPGQGGLITAALTRQYAQLPTERLHELSVGIPPFSPQGIAIQRALQIHTMNAGAGIAPLPGAPTAPAQPAASPGLAAPPQPAMPGVQGIGADRGGRMRLADGGFPAAGPVTDMKGNIIGRVPGLGVPAPLHLQDGGDADEGEAGGVIALPPIDVTAPAPPGFHNLPPAAPPPGAKPGLVPDSGPSASAALLPVPSASGDVPRPAEKPPVLPLSPSSIEPPRAGGTLGASASTLPAPTPSRPQPLPAAASHPSLASAPPPDLGMSGTSFPAPPSEYGGRNTDPRGVAPIIAADAQKYGISPDIALRVFSHEGMQNYTGDQGTSFGAPQLHVTPGGKGDAVGDLFVRQTGLDPRDPKNEPAMIDFALKYASRHGWGAWTGARVAGVKPWEGIGSHQGLGTAPPSAVASNPPVYTVLPTTLDTPPVGEPASGAGADTGSGLGSGWRDYEKAITNLVNNAGRETAGERAMASPWMGVLSAGLGMLSSRSPYPGVAIGEGGLKGLQTWEQAQGAVPKIQLERAEAAQRQLPLLEAPFNLGLMTSMMRPSGTPQSTNGQPAASGAPLSSPSPAMTASPVGSPAAAAALASETGTGRQRQTSGAAPPAAQTLPGGTPIPIGFGQDSRFAQYDEGYRTADTLRQQAARNLAQLDAPATKAWYLTQGKFDQWQQRRQGWLTQENDALSRQTSLMQQDPRWAATRAGMEAGARVGAAVAQAGGEAAAQFPYKVRENLAYRAGDPITVHPGQGVTTGIQAMSPALRAQLGFSGSMPGPMPAGAGASAPQASTLTAPPNPVPASFVDPPMPAPTAALTAPTTQLVQQPGGGITAAPTLPGLQHFQDEAGKIAAADQAKIPQLTEAKTLLDTQHSEIVAAAGNGNYWQPGSGAQWRAKIGTWLNTISRAAGLGSVVPSDQLANLVEIRKQAFNLSTNAVHQISSRPAQIEWRAALNAVPNDEQTPFTATLLSNVLRFQNDYQRGQAQYVIHAYEHGVAPQDAAEAYRQMNGDRLAGLALAQTYLDMAKARPGDLQSQWINRLLQYGKPSAAFDREWGEQPGMNTAAYGLKSWSGLFLMLAGKP